MQEMYHVKGSIIGFDDMAGLVGEQNVEEDTFYHFKQDIDHIVQSRYNYIEYGKGRLAQNIAVLQCKITLVVMVTDYSGV